MRRAIALLIIVVVVPVVIAACSSASTAPKQDEPCSGYTGPGGICVEDSTATRRP